ncbi:hypothetical protein [uncultured Fusobacterium sp.]|uniref:phage baseplate protein n=1 Tax=uncultured Fusobacterium sp. TaxID=159267 RepID=UPI002607ABDA|nr:hypothetical protein [uncultured Fusobacterium sp.]
MSLKEKINLVKQQLEINEIDTMALEKSSGKKLVDYESIDALVADLMEYYNGELKKKAASSHTHDDRYFTESEINEKFKNFCPFPINSLYLSLGSENPSSLWLGTTWAKQEGRFLLGSSSSYGLGSTGGASTVKLTVTNLPSHTHSATTAAHTHTQPTHTHTFQIRMDADEGAGGPYYGTPGNGHYGAIKTSNPTTASGGDTTGSATPSISVGSTGSGTAFSIMPPYLTVNIWKRLS